MHNSFEILPFPLSLPVSNLSNVGKLVENVAVNRFSDHVEVNNLDQLMQSACKGHHSVETALVNVSDEMVCAVKSKQWILMAPLDLSAAFDTIYHQKFGEIFWCKWKYSRVG